MVTGEDFPGCYIVLVFFVSFHYSPFERSLRWWLCYRVVLVFFISLASFFLLGDGSRLLRSLFSISLNFSSFVRWLLEIVTGDDCGRRLSRLLRNLGFLHFLLFLLFWEMVTEDGYGRRPLRPLRSLVFRHSLLFLRHGEGNAFQIIFRYPGIVQGSNFKIWRKRSCQHHSRAKHILVSVSQTKSRCHGSQQYCRGYKTPCFVAVTRCSQEKLQVLRSLFLKNVALISEKKTRMSEGMPERMSEELLQSLYEVESNSKYVAHFRRRMRRRWVGHK